MNNRNRCRFFQTARFELLPSLWLVVSILCSTGHAEVWLDENFESYTSGTTLAISPPNTASNLITSAQVGAPNGFLQVTNNGINTNSLHIAKAAASSGTSCIAIFSLSDASNSLARNQGYVAFKVKQPSPNQAASDANTLVSFRLGPNDTNVLGNNNAPFVLVDLLNNTNSNNILAKTGSGYQNKISYPALNSGSPVKVQIWYNNSTTSYDYTNPAGTPTNLPANTFVVYADSTLVTSNNAAPLPTSTTNSNGGALSSNIGKVGFFVNSKYSADFLIDDLYVASAAPASTAGTSSLWLNSGADWTNPACWSNNTLPPSDGVASFAAVGAGNNEVNLGSGQTVGGLAFSNGANAYTFSGAYLQIGLNGISSLSANTQTFRSKMYLANSDQTWSTASGGALVLSNLDLTTTNSTNGRTLTLSGAGNYTFLGSVANGGTATNGALIVANSGITTLSGSNSFSSLTLAVGTTVLNGSNAGSGMINLGLKNFSNAVLRLGHVNGLNPEAVLTGPSSTTYMGTLDLAAGAGNYWVNAYGGGNMAFTNSSTNSANLTFTNATNTITTSAGTSGGKTLANNSSNLDIVFSNSVDIGSTGANNANITFSGEGNFRLKGNVFNNGDAVRGILKDGNGTLSFYTNNSYNGPTIVNNGTLEVSYPNGIPSLGVSNILTVGHGSKLKANTNLTVGPMSITNGGTLQMALGTQITSVGAVNLSGATVSLTGTPSASSYTLVSGSSLSGTPTLSPAIPGYELSVDATSVKLVKSAVVGSTFDTTYPPGSENTIGPNGLSNLMNYALGQNGPSAAYPAAPVLSTDSNGMTLTAQGRTDDTSLRFYVQWTTDLSGVNDSWDLHSTEVLPPNLTGTIPYGADRKFIRLKVVRP